MFCVDLFLVRKLRGDFDLGFELLLFCSIRFVQKVVYLYIVHIKDKCSLLLLRVSAYMIRRLLYKIGTLRLTSDIVLYLRKFVQADCKSSQYSSKLSYLLCTFQLVLRKEAFPRRTSFSLKLTRDFIVIRIMVENVAQLLCAVFVIVSRPDSFLDNVKRDRRSAELNIE